MALALTPARWWVAAALLAALAACGGGGPTLPKLAPGAVVLAFGDSLTHGTGATPEQSYPAVLARRIGHPVVNAGIPGELTAEGLRRLPGVLERTSPALVILCHGGNDMLRHKDLGAAERNIREMIRLVRARGAAVVLVGVPKPGLFLGTADFYERIAKDMKVPIEDHVLPDLLGDNRYKSDVVHPNAAGYARMAEAVEKLLRSRGAL